MLALPLERGEMEIDKSGLTCYREGVTEARGGEEGRRAYLCNISHDLGQARSPQ